MPSITSVKGTRDFYPEDMALRNWLYGHIRAVSTGFGYQEYDGPFLEKLDLYAAKSGEELVREQSFVFPDRSGEMIALRPELTPSLARMIALRIKSLPAPVRWWSFGPFWRYENPQKGRTREFFQWNIDLLGIDNPASDAELAAVAASFFAAVGLTPSRVQILVNSRELADEQLAALGVPTERRPDIYHLVDRRERMSPSAWDAYVQDQGIGGALLRGLHAMLSNQDAWRNSAELTAFFNSARSLGVDAYMRFDPGVIRGLDYYTGIVFEARDVEGQHRAILGGGRYDNLVADVGGDPVPAVGFAMGDVVIGLVLQEAGALPEFGTSPAQVLITNFSPELLGDSLELAKLLRQAGFRVEWYPEASRLGKQFKYADRYRIPAVAIVGPDESAAGNVTFRNMSTGEQTTVSLAEAAASLARVLS
jgi:histidyl-tRNA synthetase